MSEENNQDLDRDARVKSWEAAREIARHKVRVADLELAKKWVKLKKVEGELQTARTQVCMASAELWEIENAQGNWINLGCYPATHPEGFKI